MFVRVFHYETFADNFNWPTLLFAA